VDYEQLKDKIKQGEERMKALGVVHCDLEFREGIYPNILKKNGDIRFIDFHLHELVD